MQRSGSDADSPISAPLAEQFLAGDGAPGEVERIGQRVQAAPKGRALVEALRAALGEDPSFDAEMAYERLRKRWDRKANHRVGAPPRREMARGTMRFGRRTFQDGPFSIWTTRQRLASLGLALATASALVIGAFRIRGTMVTDSPPIRTYTTLPGRHMLVSFGDGAHALLGPATTLWVIAHDNRRIEVHVSGEALFAVTHHPNQSFEVQAGNTSTRVLGTTFMVRKYPRDRVVQVVVADGRVSLSERRTPSRGKSPPNVAMVLTKGMLGAVDDSGQVQLRPHIAVEEYTGWVTGTLVFRNTPASTVVTEIGRAYGVEIRIADSVLATLPLSWSISLSQRSLADVLEALVDVLQASPVRTGSVITFVPGRSASPRPVTPRSLFSTEHTYGK